MAAFHVFVEGPTDPSPEGSARLAERIANHYGLPAADLVARIARGRFRVKGNADRATAETYVRDLVLLGARCTIEEATVANSQRATPLPFPAVRPATPLPIADEDAAPAAPKLPPPRPPAPRPPPGPSAPPPSALPPRASTPPPMDGQYQSGLSAAFSGEMQAGDFGALDGGGASFSLSSVDGADGADDAGGAGRVEPPGAGLPASIGPAPERAKPAKAAKPKDEPLDMFAPPDAQGEEFKVELAADEVATSARKRASTPPPVEEAEAPVRESSQSSPPAAARRTQPSMQVPNATMDGGVSRPSRFGPLAEPRVRFAAGVLIAILLGFVPAHLIAGMREEAAYEQIDSKVIAAQQLAETPDAYATLDRLRSDQLGRKESARRNAAILALLIWGAAAGGIAYVWFRKIPWD